MKPADKIKEREAYAAKRNMHIVFFDLALSVSDTAFDELTKHLLPKAETWLTRVVIAKGLHVKHLRLILLNLLKADCQDRRPYVAFRRDRRYYFSEEAKQQGPTVRPDILIPIIDTLEEEGFIEGIKGSNAGCYISRMRATDRLREHFQSVRHIFPPEPPKYIILKNTKGKVIPFEETEQTRQMQENLVFINEVISRHSMSLDASEEELANIDTEMGKKGRRLDLLKTTLARVFNVSFERGGRFYGGWWEYCPKGYRHLIRIDGEETVYLDYTSTIVNLVYLHTGLDIPEGDAYTVSSARPGSREFQKKAMQMILNTSSRHRAWQALREQTYKKKDANNTGLTEYQLLDALEEKHSPIKHMLFGNIGIKFHRIESDLAECILLSLARKGIPVLPIHDGFIVKKTDTEELETAMKEAGMKSYGKLLPFKAE